MRHMGTHDEPPPEPDPTGDGQLPPGRPPPPDPGKHGKPDPSGKDDKQ